jgi:hypothetical protein
MQIFEMEGKSFSLHKEKTEEENKIYVFDLNKYSRISWEIGWRRRGNVLLTTSNGNDIETKRSDASIIGVF